VRGSFRGVAATLERERCSRWRDSGSDFDVEREDRLDTTPFMWRSSSLRRLPDHEPLALLFVIQKFAQHRSRQALRQQAADACSLGAKLRDDRHHTSLGEIPAADSAFATVTLTSLRKRMVIPMQPHARNDSSPTVAGKQSHRPAAVDQRAGGWAATTRGFDYGTPKHDQPHHVAH